MKNSIILVIIFLSALAIGIYLGTINQLPTTAYQQSNLNCLKYEDYCYERCFPSYMMIGKIIMPLYNNCSETCTQRCIEYSSDVNESSAEIKYIIQGEKNNG